MRSTLWPSVFGAHNWQAMSFNPQTGLVYIPYIQLGMRFTKTPATFSGVIECSGALRIRTMAKARCSPGTRSRKMQRWNVPLDWMWNGGTLTTGGNLVFQGTADGYFSAYDATNGARVWRFNAGLGIIAAPISYASRQASNTCRSWSVGALQHLRHGTR